MASDRVIIVNTGSSTTNAAEAKKLITEGKLEKIVVISDEIIEAASFERLTEIAINGLDKLSIGPQEFVRIASCNFSSEEILDKIKQISQDLDRSEVKNDKTRLAQLLYFWMTKYPDDFSSTETSERLQNLFKSLSKADNAIPLPPRFRPLSFDPHSSEKLGSRFKVLIGVESRDVALNILNYVMEDDSGWRTMRRLSKSFKSFAEELIPFENREIITALIKKGIQPKKARLTDLEPRIVATQMTNSQLKVRNLIRPNEMVDLKWTDTKSSSLNAPNLRTTIERFNLSSKWVANLVLSQDSREERKRVFIWVLDLAKEMLDLKNFEAVAFIQSALSSSSIYRLNFLVENLPKKSVKIRRIIEELTNVSHGWKNIRRLCAEERYCLPYIGIPLSDLKAISEGNPNNYCGTNLIDLSLFNLRSGPIEMIIRKHQLMPISPPIPAIQSMLRVEIDSDRLPKTENEMWLRSLEIQPQESSNSTTS